MCARRFQFCDVLCACSSEKSIGEPAEDPSATGHLAAVPPTVLFPAVRREGSARSPS